MSAIPITITGTIAADPVARTLPSGRACSSFRLAVNHWRVDKATGEFLDDGTSWFGVDCYGDLARNSTMSLSKGTAVIVTGSLRNREWSTEDRSGIAPTVVAEHIGPDLRFGTAHYQRAKGQERTGSPTAKTETDSATSGSGAWGGLDDSTAGSVPSRSDGAAGVAGPVDAAAGGGVGGNRVDRGAGNDDSEENTVDRAAADSDDTGAGRADDVAGITEASAIAASTAAAAAPF